MVSMNAETEMLKAFTYIHYVHIHVFEYEYKLYILVYTCVFFLIVPKNVKQRTVACVDIRA